MPIVSAGDGGSVGINRYIMECKLIIMHLGDIGILELIDTLWNVNTIF